MSSAKLTLQRLAREAYAQARQDPSQLRVCRDLLASLSAQEADPAVRQRIQATMARLDGQAGGAPSDGPASGGPPAVVSSGFVVPEPPPEGHVLVVGAAGDELARHARLVRPDGPLHHLDELPPAELARLADGLDDAAARPALCTSSRPWLLPPALLARFGRKLPVPAPAPADVAALVRAHGGELGEAALLQVCELAAGPAAPGAVFERVLASPLTLCDVAEAARRGAHRYRAQDGQSVISSVGHPPLSLEESVVRAFREARSSTPAREHDLMAHFVRSRCG